MLDYQTGYAMTDIIQHLTYDDFGRVIRNDRGGRKADMSYAYDQLHGWTTGVKSGGGFEQKLYRETGALLLKNGKAGMYQFQGGYYSFNSNGVLDGCHYYIQDYQGPRSIKEGLMILREKTNLQVRGNRMTVSSDDWGGIVSEYTASVTDYYPYGNPHKGGSDYKYSGKYLDRTYGLDLYDFEARRFDAIVPVFDRLDPLAWDYTSLSPYVYCAGDPVNCVDKDGKMPLLITGAIGAVIGAGIGAATSYLSGGTSEEIKNAALAGAAAGLTEGSATAAGALVSGISSGVEQDLNDYQNNGEVDWGNVTTSAATSAVLSKLGNKSDDIVKSVSQKIDASAAKTFSSDVAKETAKLTKIQNNGGNLGGSKAGSRATIRTKGEISGKAKANVQNYNNPNKQWILSEVRQVSFAAEPINKVTTSAVNVGVQKGLEVVTDYINDEK